VALARADELTAVETFAPTNVSGRVRSTTDRKALRPPPAFVAAVTLAAIGATLWSAATHSMLLYGDARAHLNVARHVTDGLRIGLTQLGSVWLPLPHILMVPLVAFNPLWHSGAAGAIVSGVCFVYSAIRLFTIIEELTASRLAAWLGAAVFVANLNMLYIQSTALTEPVLLAFMIGTVYHLTRWMRTLALWDLMWAAVLVFCATLTRYEGWALLVGAIGAVVVWSWLTERRYKAPQANLVLFALVGSYGIGLWLLYNLIIFGNAFYFLTSAFSAQAINGAQAQYGLLGTKGSLFQSTLTYAWDVIGVVGPVVLVTAGVCALGALLVRDAERRRIVFVLGLLFVPIAFEVLSLYVGQTTIRVPQLPPHGMWNDRYGLMALPFCAVAVGVLVGRFRRNWTAPVVAMAVTAGIVVMSLGTPLTLADGRTGTSSATAGHPEIIANYLRHHYHGGEILADDSVASPLMFATYLDLKEFVTIGMQPFWQHALHSPAQNVAWVIAYPGDRVSGDLRTHPDRFAWFHLVLTQGQIRLFRRMPPSPTRLPVQNHADVRTRTLALAAAGPDQAVPGGS
jgi:hypothetical protein